MALYIPSMLPANSAISGRLSVISPLIGGQIVRVRYTPDMARHIQP